MTDSLETRCPTCWDRGWTGCPDCSPSATKREALDDCDCGHVRGLHPNDDRCSVALCGCLFWNPPPVPSEVEVTTPDDAVTPEYLRVLAAMGWNREVRAALRGAADRIAALEAGLSVFADIASIYDHVGNRHAAKQRVAYVTVADLRAARALLGEGTAPDEVVVAASEKGRAPDEEKNR